MKNYEIEIKDISFWENSKTKVDGMRILWNATNIGFGCLDIYKDQDGKLIIDNEAMSKEFVMAVFEKIYDIAIKPY